MHSIVSSLIHPWELRSTLFIAKRSFLCLERYVKPIVQPKVVKAVIDLKLEVDSVIVLTPYGEENVL